MVIWPAEDDLMSEPNLDESHCMALLEPHLGRLHKCMMAAFARYNETPAHILAEHDERAATSGVHTHILHEIAREFSEVEGATILDCKGLKVLNLGDKLVLRFKQVDEDGRHQNHTSRQQERFDRQLPLPGLPPEATRLTLGYEADPAFAEIIRVSVGCPLGHKSLPLWLAQINVMDEHASWEDITPARLPGTERFERFRDDDAAAE
jgi:hypothetical protein